MSDNVNSCNLFKLAITSQVNTHVHFSFNLVLTGEVVSWCFFVIVVPALTNYIRPSTSMLAPLPTPWPLLYQVCPLSPNLVHCSIQQLFQWLCMHPLLWRCWLHLWNEDWVLHRLSTSSSKSCQHRSRRIFLHCLRLSQRQMMKGRFPWEKTSLYVCPYHVHLDTITHGQKVEDQHNKKACLLLHISIHHVDSNPMLHTHREEWRMIA